jgi:pimeloyl-ACP methyl ester carboxylesterase
MRGHGQTDAPDDFSRYTLDIVVEDIRQLLQHLGIQKAVIGGLSLGGYLTLHFYHQHPDMAAALILMGTGPGYRTLEKAQEWNRDRLDCARILETQGMRGFLDSEYYGGVYYTTPDVMMKHNPEGLANISRGIMINPWGLDVLLNIRVPTLILCGDKDSDFLTATDYMAQKIPGAKKVIIANAGHGINIDQPQVFESTVLDFLDGLHEVLKKRG